MEKLIDGCMRDLLTSVGGYDLAMTEFLRITTVVHPRKKFRRICPEIESHCLTSAGTPVVLQLLGGVPEAMAANAAKAIKLGVKGIDVNFGCPSKSVNSKGAGAALLKEPHTLYKIMKAIRDAIPEEVELSAKIRLGYDDMSLIFENVAAIEEGGADFITIHARTKADGYTRPARWESLAKIREVSHIPVVANGDINSVEDYIKCAKISGCEDVMLGRGAVANPGLAREIKLALAGDLPKQLEWHEVYSLLMNMLETRRETHNDMQIAMRFKQWLVYLKNEYKEAEHCFNTVRHINEYSKMESLIKN